MALFSTCIYEEDASEGSVASVRLERQETEEVLFEICYDYDNQPSHLYYSSEQTLSESVSVLQRFIDEGGIPEPDIDVLRFMQSLAFCIMGACKPEELMLLTKGQDNKKAQYVADVIRTQVLKNTTGAVRTKVWGLPMDDTDSTLTVATNEVIGELSQHEDIASIPALQIEYEDKARDGTVYIYSRYNDGECKLVTSQPGDEEPDEELEEELAYFRDSIGASIPGKGDVKLLRRMLSKAVLLDLPTN